MTEEGKQGSDTIEGVSTRVRDGAYPSLEDAIHNAAHDAVDKGYGGQAIRIDSIEFTAENPHITQYRVTGTPI